MTIEFGDFILEPFDEDNIMHRYISVVLDNDKDFHDYVGETKVLVDNAKYKHEKGFNDCVYVVRCDDDYLGIISLIILDDNPYLAIGVIPERQGLHFGKNIMMEYIEYIFQTYSEYKEIFTSIHPENEKSINNVLKLGFKQLTKTRYVKTRD